MDLDTLKKLAGVGEYSFKGLKPVDENISHTGTEKRRIEKEKNLRPGDEDWFKLWFSRPYWKGQEYPPGLRSRKK
jgi:hypothetical protein